MSILSVFSDSLPFLISIATFQSLLLYFRSLNLRLIPANLLYFAKLYYALTSINKNFYYSNFYSVSEESTDITYGDANLDKNVTISDSVAILQNIANSEKYPLDDNARANADVYNPGDGITGSDANSIMKLDAGIIDSLPEVIS